MSFQSAYRGASHPRAHREHLYVDPTSISASTASTYIAVVLIGGYLLVHHLDLFPTLPLSQLLWNLLVYVTPASLVIALESRSNKSSSDLSQSYAKARTFAAKSDALRKMLGLSGNGLSYTAGRSRSLSGLGMMFKHTSATSLPGLGNWDNSCYQNSILQGLSALPSLRAFLERTHRSIPGATSRAMNLALTGLVEDLNNPKNLGRKFWTPPALKSMSSWQQQDAQEYYSKVVDALEKELGKGLAIQTSTKGLGYQPPEKSSSHEGGSGDQKGDLLRNPLEGMLAQRVGCLKCGYVEGLSLIPFNCLTVPLGERSTYELATCLDAYTGLEPISGVECAHCTLLRQKEILEKLVSLKDKPLAEAEDIRNEESQNELHGEVAPFQENFGQRLAAVNAALEEGDFSDTTLSKKCSISSKQCVLVTKTRQAVIARQSQALVIHVNRSVFDEYTGFLRKNYAEVRFPKFLDLSRWSLGQSYDGTEQWSSNPAASMLDRQMDEKQSLDRDPTDLTPSSDSMYALRAAITHQGRHENGHYIAYRQNPPPSGDEDESERSWWRLSDEDVTATSEEAVLSQGGVFMLFYEQATTTEMKEYANLLQTARSGAENENSADTQETLLAAPDPDTAELSALRVEQDAPPATNDPEIFNPLQAAAPPESTFGLSAVSVRMDPGITPPRRSSLKHSSEKNARYTDEQSTASNGSATPLPSIDRSMTENEETPSPIIPERKASKLTTRGKKSNGGAKSPLVPSMRTSGAKEGGTPSPLGSPRTGMVSAK